MNATSRSGVAMVRSAKSMTITSCGTARRAWSNMLFMDAQGRPMIHDGHGNPAGQRPGFLYSDGNEQAERARSMPMREYDEAIRERWRQGPGQRQTQRNPNRRRSTARKLPSLPPMRNMTEPLASVGADDRLPIRAARSHR